MILDDHGGGFDHVGVFASLNLSKHDKCACLSNQAKPVLIKLLSGMDSLSDLSVACSD